MMTSSLPDVFVFGAGAIGLQHAAAFQHCGAEVSVISQSGGRRSSQEVEFETCSAAGFDSAALTGQGVVIALPIREQIDLLESVLSYQPKFVLIEKPGSFELDRLARVAETSATPIYVAFNRRFLGSVKRLKELLSGEEVFSIKCDVSENLLRLKSLVSDDYVLKYWHLANSSHLLDLTMYLSESDKADLLFCLSKGRSSFSTLPGAVTAVYRLKSTIVNFSCDFRVSGSWFLEIVSSNGRYRLSPIETLTKFDEASFRYIPCVVKDNPNAGFKAGFVEQATACLLDSSTELVTLDSVIHSLETLDRIFRG